MAPAIRFSVLAILAVILVLLFSAHQCASQVTITPSSSNACPGDEVVLVCQHPELANNTQTNRYMSALSWRENGRSVQTAPGTTYQVTSTADFTSTTLTITISSDYFSGGFFYYDCFLLLSAGGLDTSGNSTLAVPELSSPVLTSASSLESNITVEWLAVNCARSYNISWQCMGPSSNGSISTTNTMITVPVNGSTNCTLRVVGIDAEGFAGPNTTAAVYPGFPRPTNASSSTLSCTSRSLLLTCQFGGGEYTDIQWNSSRGSVDSSDGTLLTIGDATILQPGTEFWCSGVPVGGTATYRVTGESYVYNESLTCEPLTTPPLTLSGGDSTAAAAAGGVVVVLVAVGVVAGVGVVVFRRRRSTVKVDCGDNEASAPLTALIVAQALSSAGVDVLTVRGCCASSRCQPCTCDWQPGGGGVMDLLCRYREKTVALHILSSQEKQRIDNLETIRDQLSTTDHCFALWPSRSVPRMIRQEVSRAIVPEQNEGQCVTVLALAGLPWGSESRERKTFIKQVLAVLESQPELVTVAMTVAMEVEEGSVAVLPSPPALPVPVPQVDVLRLIHNLFLAKPVPTGRKDKPIVWSEYAIVGESPKEEKTDSSAPSPSPHSTTSSHAPLIPEALLPEALIPDVEAQTTPVKNYTRSEVLEGLCSVLTILGAEVLSVRGTCRRRDCVASAAACHHCSVYQPDIVAQHNATTFVVKCIINHIDGAVTTDHMTRMNTTRQRLGLSLGILLYDVAGNSPQPDNAGNCTQLAIGPYQWGTPWVKHTLIVMYSVLRTPIAADSLTPPPNDTLSTNDTLPLNDTLSTIGSPPPNDTPPPNPDGVMYASLDFSVKQPIKPPPLETVVVYSEVVTDGTSLGPPKQAVKKNKKKVYEDDPKDVPYQDDILSVLEKKGVKVVEKTAGAFVGTFHSVQFLAVCRAEPIRDITEIDINRVLAIIPSTPVKSRLYLCNTDTIPIPRLLQLEKGGGMFVQAFGHVSGEPPSQSWTERVEMNFLRACKDWLELPTPQSSSEPKKEEEVPVVPPRLEEEHGEMMAKGPSKPQVRPPLPPPPDVVVTTLPKQPTGSSQSEVHVNGVRKGPAV